MTSLEQLTATSKDYARLLLTIGENRMELLAVELQQELRRVLCTMMLILGVAVFGLLSAGSLTAALVLMLTVDPAIVLFSVTGIYLLAGVILYWRLSRRLRNWQVFAASLRELRKDCECRERSGV